MVTQSISKKSGFPFIYTKETVTIKANPFILENIGTLKEDRADKLRETTSEGLHKKK